MRILCWATGSRFNSRQNLQVIRPGAKAVLVRGSLYLVHLPLCAACGRASSVYDNIADDMKTIRKIILDTNVLVSALRSSLGPSFALVQAIRAGKIRTCCSPALFLEYEDVLKRPAQLAAFGLKVGDVDAILADLAGYIVPVSTHYQWRPQLRDPSDEMVLEAAANASAEAIVTYNLRDFAPAKNFGILVLNPEQTFRHFQLPTPTQKGTTP
jgi:putative PIN family toxin of toxin-antitoxin system